MPGDTSSARVTYPNPVECYPLMPFHLMKQPSEKYLRTIMRAFRTFHNYFHVADKTMDHTQGLRYSHPSLLLR